MDCDEAVPRCWSSPATGLCWSCPEAARLPTPCAHSTRKSAWETTSRTRLRCARWISSGFCCAPMLPGAEAIVRLVAPRALGLLAVAPAFAGRPGVPESWEVTSDSLAVLAAGAIGAEEAILLKPVDGGAVDPYVPEAVRRTGVTVVVRAPGGLGTTITHR